MPPIKKPTRRARYSRTTVPLTGTHRKVAAYLSFDADLALLYAGAWLARAGRGVSVPASAIIRAAVIAYAAHLDGLDEDTAYREVKRHCAVLPPDEDAQRMALLRLHAVPPDEPLPSWRVIQRGPRAIREAAELMARVEAYL